MCAFAHVTTILPFREVCANSLGAKLAKAKEAWQVENALYDHIEELTAFGERESRMMFRLVNMMTPRQLAAYDAIAARLGKDATNEQWTAAIKQWKEPPVALTWLLTNEGSAWAYNYLREHQTLTASAIQEAQKKQP